MIRVAYTEHGVIGDGRPRRRIPTGFPAIDSAIGGLSPGELTIIAARPNVGKSTALLYMMRTMDLAGFRPGLISLEDGPITVGERVQTFYSRIPSMDVRRAGHTYRSAAAVTSALKNSQSSNIQYMFPIGGSSDEVVDSIDSLVGAGCNAILVDYLTAVEVDGRDLRMAYSMLITRLKGACYRHGVPLILAAQLARAKWDSKTGGFVDEPDLQELGETSFLERKAELVALFWRDRGGTTHGKIAKLKYGRHLPKFYVYQDESTGLLSTEEYRDEPKDSSGAVPE